MNKLIISTFFLCVFFQVYSKEKIDFSIPDSLKENADVVILSHEISYERKSKKTLIEKSKLIFTVLNNRAEGFKDMVINYEDGLSEIKSFKCSIYDKNGKLAKKTKPNDIYDVSYYNSYTLYSDNRVKIASPLSATYPYTVVFEYEKVYNGFMGLSGWAPISRYRTAVKHASLSISAPENLPFVVKVNNKKRLTAKEENIDGTINYFWEINNEKALEDEYFSPNLSTTTPNIYIAPKTFKYDGYEGSNESWKTLGNFNHSLFYQENELSDKTKSDLDEFKNKAQDPKELTRLVYEYTQSKTRYVGIQLGIGGWQPFPSLTVDETGYGDCKALSYYTKVMLEYVGIESIYTVIGSGYTKIKYDDFVTNQTNHIILCVPFDNDTIWLECTSQTAPFNYLSSSCTNRKALLVKKEHSKLVYIPQKHKNVWTQEAQMTLQEDNRIFFNNTSTYSGKFFDYKNDLEQMSPKELRKYLQKNIPVSDIELTSCSTELDKEKALIKVYSTFYASNITSQAGNRLFVDINPFTQMATYKKQRSERQNEVVVRSNSTYEDFITLKIPDGYTIEYIPEGKKDSSIYANYSFSVYNENDVIKMERKLTINSGNYPKEKYEEFIDFINGVAKIDNSKLILKKL